MKQVRYHASMMPIAKPDRLCVYDTDYASILKIAHCSLDILYIYDTRQIHHQPEHSQGSHNLFFLTHRYSSKHEHSSKGTRLHTTRIQLYTMRHDAEKATVAYFCALKVCQRPCTGAYRLQVFDLQPRACSGTYRSIEIKINIHMKI